MIHLKKKDVMIGIVLGSLIISLCPLHSSQFSENESYTYHIAKHNIDSERLGTGDSNFDLLNTVLDQKRDYFNAEGYFNQTFVSSLQATYYALFILNVTDALNTVESEKLIDFIMGFYVPENHCFRDAYTYRYLDTDFSEVYYPLCTELETTCYALWSLHLLGALNQVNVPDLINYILSCYNDDSGGFIGRPYSPELGGKFKVSTMDNTYYAIITFDLVSDWNSLPVMKSDLVDFIDPLQISSGSPGYVGGFKNDKDPNFDSLMGRSPDLDSKDPSMLSSYYCIKSLKVLDRLDVVEYSAFNQWLEDLYYGGIFNMHISLMNNYSDVVASALGLELAGITGFTIDRQATLDVVFSQRTAVGAFKGSRYYTYYELIDTFQIMRSLNETGDISQLSPSAIGETVAYVGMCAQVQGYSLLSKDHMSLESLWAITNAFEDAGRDDELPLEVLGNIIKAVYYLIDRSPDTNGHTFFGNTKIDARDVKFRSFPIEYYTTSKHTYLETFDSTLNQKTSYFGLAALKNLNKLGVLSLDLNDVVEGVIDSQFLESGYSNYGGYLIHIRMADCPVLSLQNDNVGFEYTYYAVKCLELLADYLELGDIQSLVLNPIALRDYIVDTDRLVQGPSSGLTYYHDSVITSPNLVLQYTFYALEMLEILDMNNLNLDPIRNYVLSALDYSNLQSVYYCFKISELLGLGLDFDFSLTQQLLPDLYYAPGSDFLLQQGEGYVHPQALAWVWDMAANDRLRLNIDAPATIMLGDVLDLYAYPCNLLLDGFGPDVTFSFVSDQLNVTDLEQKGAPAYEAHIPIPVKAASYPHITGNVLAKKGMLIIESIPLTIATTYDLDLEDTIAKDTGAITFTLTASLVAANGKAPLDQGSVYAEIYRDGKLIDTETFDADHSVNDRQSTFSWTFEPKDTDDYEFQLYLLDGYTSQPQKILEETLDYTAHPLESPENISMIVTGSLFSVVITFAVLLVKRNDVVKKRLKS